MPDNGMQPAPPVAPGQEQLDSLATHGFTASEIAAYKQRQTERLVNGGFQAKEIDAYWGSHLDSPIVSNFAASNIQQHLAAGNPAPPNLIDYLSAGWQHSVTGLIQSGGRDTTLDPRKADVWGGLMFSAGQLAGDLPWAYGGAVGGGAAGGAIPGAGETGVSEAIGVGFGAAAFPEAARQTLLAAHNAGQIHSWNDALTVVGNGAWQTLQSGAAGGLGGAVVGPVGGAVLRATGSELAATGASAVSSVGAATAASSAEQARMPTWQDFTLGATTLLGMHLTGVASRAITGSEPVVRVRTNMQRIWANTGMSPTDQVRRANVDPAFRQELLQQDVQGDPVTPHFTAHALDNPPRSTPVPQPGYRGPSRSDLMNSTSPLALTPHAQPTYISNVDGAMNLLAQLEGGVDPRTGRARISPAGAIGKYQIMPGTARHYGFDPGRLTDLEYNTAAARVIISDLWRRYDGNMDAIAVAYNAGPGRANEYLRAGPGTRLEAVEDKTVRGGIRFVRVSAAKDESFLPMETQKYLANGRRLQHGPLSAAEGKGGVIPEGEQPPDPNARPDGRPIPSFDIGEFPERLDAEVQGQDLSAAEVWAKAEDDELTQGLLENVGEQPRRSFTDLANPDRLLTHFFSELQPARQIDNQLVRAGLMNRTTDFGAEDALRQTYASDARAGVWVRYGQIDSPDTKSIVEGSHSLLDAVRAMRQNGGDPDGFRAYLLAQRIVEKATENLRKARAFFEMAETADKENSTDETKKTLAKAQKALDAIMSGEAEAGIDTGFNPFIAKEITRRASFNDKYAEAARIWTEVNNSVLDYAQRAGRYSPESVNAMKALNTTYVSMRRIMGDNASFESPHTAGFTIGSPLKRMEGSDRQIVDPIAATIDNMRMLVRSADQNWARGRVIELAHSNPEIAATLGLREVPINVDPNEDQIEEALKAYGFQPPENIEEADPEDEERWIKAIEAYKEMIAERLDKGLADNQFSHYENGQRKVYEIANKDFANLLKGSYSRGSVDLVTKTLQTFAAGTRTGIVIMPDFPGRSSLSHQFIQFINDPLHPPPVLTWLRGITHVLGNDHVYQDAVAKGAMGAALVDMDRDYLAYDVDHLFSETGAAERVWNQVKHPLQLAQVISERIDAANRVGYTLHAAGKGIDPLKAATQARKAGIDYAERATASWVNWYSSITPFFRPKLLYMKNFAEAYAERPFETLAYAVASIAVPTAIMWAINKWQDENEFKNDPGRQFRNLPRWQKDYAMITPEIAGQRFRLRYPEGSGAVFGAALNRILDAMYDHDPQAMHEWSDLVLQQIPLSAPAMVQAPLETLTNHHLATGAPLIPSSLEDASPQLQYTDNTTPAAKTIARIIDPMLQSAHMRQLAPIQIDHLVQGWTGTAGLHLLKVLGAPFSRPGPPMDVADIPFVQGFVFRNPGSNAQAIQDYYDTKQQFDRALNDLEVTRRNVRGGNTDDVAFVQKEYAYAEADRRLNNVSHALGLMRSSLWGIYADKTLTTDEKRQHIENVYNQMIILAKSATTQMQEFAKEHPR